MRRFETMVVVSQNKSRKELVKAICAQTCLKSSQVYSLLKVLELKDKLDSRYLENDRPWPTILIEALRAPDAVALAKRALEEEWTAKHVRQEATSLKVAHSNPPPPIPTGKYPTIVVDPPWAYGNTSGRQRPDYADRTMTLEEVAAFDLQRWRPETEGHLYLWVTDAYAGDVYQIVRAWGYEPKVWLIWVKDRIGMGNYFRHQHECCVFAVKGKLRLKRLDASTVFQAKLGRHSEKPAAFYRLVESCSPGPYLDVFARAQRPGWDVFGDEIQRVYQQRLVGSNESAIVT